MNLTQYSKAKKNCLLAFVNKKIVGFNHTAKVAESFASFGYHFEKISLCAFDNSTEIVNALTDGIKYHENIVIYCPLRMEKTFKDFFETQLGSAFDGLNMLKTQDCNVFILLSDAEQKLAVEDICGYLDKLYGVTYSRAYVKTVGAPLLLLDDALKDAKSICPELEFNITDSFGDCRTEIVYDSTVTKAEFDRAYRAIVARVSDYVYALEDITLAERLVQLLKLRRMKIAVAESFTGGGIAKRLVEVSGVSEVYVEGLNTYANSSKINRLGVDELILKQYGAVSEQTAEQMAQGLISQGVCDVSVSTTGIAGPKSDNTKKPVGLAFIAVGSPEGADIYEYNLKGTREEITQTAINLALFAVYKRLK